jgi:hypothetical protein
MPRPVELRGVSDQTIEALEVEAEQDPVRAELIARRLSHVPPEFIDAIQRGGIGAVAGGRVFPAGFTHPTIRPPTLRGRIRVWKHRQYDRLGRAIVGIAELFDPDLGRDH